MRQFDRKGGDFGAEIIGPLVIPILIEAGKQLWAAYLKKLTEKAGNNLADLTVDGVKTIVRRQWAGPDGSAAEDYEKLLREAASKQGLAQAQTDQLIAAVRGSQKRGEIVA